MASRTARPERGSVTRELILATAERLFAEHGIGAVSNRQIGEAAGQANPAVVNYHFGGKTELIRAIARQHAERIEQLRVRQVAEIGNSADIYDWVAAAVRPITAHLAELGAPSWYARFHVQLQADPALLSIAAEEFNESPSLRLLAHGAHRALAEVPTDVLVERTAMVRFLIQHMCADRERALAEGAPTLHASWDALADSLVDAIGGLWLAPSRRH